MNVILSLLLCLIFQCGICHIKITVDIIITIIYVFIIFRTLCDSGEYQKLSENLHL